MEKREDLIKILLKSFLNDLSASAKPFTQEETLHFIGVLNEYLKGVYNNEPSIPEYNYDGNPFDDEEFIENHLLKPYREKMTPFFTTRLTDYFAKDEHNKRRLFQKLKINEPLLNHEEYEEYILRIYSVLTKIKSNLYLRPIEDIQENPAEAQKLIDNPEEMEKQGFKGKNKEYTRSRQILLYYFMLRLMGITRLDANAINLAEFGHVLFYWPVDVTKNNDVYKKLCRAPYIHETDKENLKDLEYVKRQFENIDHAQGIAMVQKEIDSIKRK